MLSILICKRLTTAYKIVRNWFPCVLLVGLQNGAVAMENTMEIPQKK